MNNAQIAKLTTFVQIDAARTANRDPMTGRLVNRSLDRRLIACERQIAIQILGYKPEPEGCGPAHASCYAATTGELRTWASEKLAVEHNETSLKSFCSGADAALEPIGPVLYDPQYTHPY